MVRLAVWSDSLGAQLEEQRGAAQLKDVTFTNYHGDIAGFAGAARAFDAQVVAVELEQLGADPVAAAAKLRQTSGAELVVVLYSFAKRELIQALDSDQVVCLRVPMRLETLRVAMLNVIIGAMLKDKGVAYAAGSTTTNMAVADKRFTLAELGRLQEIASAVDCECPNHLSGIVISLSQFEEYSKHCENRNAEDAKIHRMLYEESAKARTIMEAALVKLCEFEQISLQPA